MDYIVKEIYVRFFSGGIYEQYWDDDGGQYLCTAFALDNLLRGLIEEYGLYS